MITRTARAEEIAGQPVAIRTDGLGRLLTINEVAELLCVPVATIYRWRHVGDGPPGYWIGRYVRSRRAEVEACVQSRADAQTVR